MTIEVTGLGTDELPYLVKIDDILLVTGERLPGAYLFRWQSSLPKKEIADALRSLYYSITDDLIGDEDRKLIQKYGVYEILNGSLQATISASPDGVGIRFGKTDFIASLDAYCADAPEVAAYFSTDYRNRIGSTRIVTPYCDLFIEQYGGNIYDVVVMADERIDLTKHITRTLQSTAQERANHPLLETTIGDIVERLREQSV